MRARNSRLTIGDLSRMAGCKEQTIRYYEKIGLLPVPDRSEGNQRLYDPPHADRLTFIRHARELGFPLDAIRSLLSLASHPYQACEAADEIAQAQLRHVEQRLARLLCLKRELQRMVEQCRGGKIEDCRVIEVLADHSRCLAESHADPAEP